MKNKTWILVLLITTVGMKAHGACYSILYVADPNNVTHDCTVGRAPSGSAIPDCISKNNADITYPGNSYCENGSDYSSCATENTQGNYTIQLYTCALTAADKKYFEQVQDNINSINSHPGESTGKIIGDLVKQWLKSPNTPTECVAAVDGPPQTFDCYYLWSTGS
jgi:hypothetical protein